MQKFKCLATFYFVILIFKDPPTRVICCQKKLIIMSSFQSIFFFFFLSLNFAIYCSKTYLPGLRAFFAYLMFLYLTKLYLCFDIILTRCVLLFFFQIYIIFHICLYIHENNFKINWNFKLCVLSDF